MNLSYEKTLNLLQTHSTNIVTSYTMRMKDNKHKCKFLECVTEGVSQSFLISIPDKFNVVVPLGSVATEVFILPVGSEIVARQLDYLKKIRGTLQSDVVSISSNIICYVNTSSSVCYRIVGEFDELYEEIKLENPIQSLVQKVTNLVEEKPTQPGVSLSGGEPFTNKVYDPLIVQSESFIFDEIELGLVYISIELNSFYENVSRIREVLIEKYAYLEDNELDVRQEKIDHLSQLFNQLTEKFKEVDEILLKRDNTSKKTLSTLGNLLTRLTKVENVSEKEGPTVNDLKSQIQTTIAEEHIKSLRLKDSIHDTLELCDILVSQVLEKIKSLKDEVDEINQEVANPNSLFAE